MTMRPTYGSTSVRTIRVRPGKYRNRPYRLETGARALYAVADGRSQRAAGLGSTAADLLGVHGRPRTVGPDLFGKADLRPLPLRGARQCMAQCQTLGRARR